MTKVLITGAGGQLATELQLTAPEGLDCRFLTRSQLDISDLKQVQQVVDEFAPDILINAAAYTAVDSAEAAREAAFKINADAPGNLAKALPSSAYLLHISTDFVFSGSANRPYNEDAVAEPRSVYGESKLAGEQVVSNTRSQNWGIIRTSWVYSAHGHNFVKTMLRFMNERDELGIVVDQVGSPTWAKGLARVCWCAAQKRIDGVFHWSDAGAISWFDFAHEIQRLGMELGLLSRETNLRPIATEAYPLPASRPAYSVMDKGKILEALPEIRYEHWQKNLHEMMEELVRLSSSQNT